MKLSRMTWIGKTGMVAGQFVTSKAGHDKGTLYVVCGQEKDFLYLCDGRLKTYESPKKKRLKHVQPVNRTVDAELQKRLENGEKVYDEEIKYAIKQYKRSITCEAKGENVCQRVM